METYRYDLHVHTSEVSACARSTADAIADFYREQGYQGIVITNHFFNGNTTVPRDGSLPWEEMVRRYCTGYEIAKKRGDEIGLDVFFGWEYSTYGGAGDFVTLGLDEAWLLAHPDVHRMEPTAYFDLVHADGGFIIHAHPFLQASYTKGFFLFPNYEDAVEVLNAGKTDFTNARAKEYAENFGLIGVSGSDCHSVGAGRLCGVETDRRVRDLADLIEIIRRKEHRIIDRKVTHKEVRT